MRTVHKTQDLLDLLIRDESQELGLLQLDRQALAKDAIKHRIAGLVFEFAQHNLALPGDLRRTA